MTEQNYLDPGQSASQLVSIPEVQLIALQQEISNLRLQIADLQRAFDAAQGGITDGVPE